MKKSLKLLMAIVLFIAVIAIANCVSAATKNLGETDPTVAESSSLRKYTINTSKITASDDLTVTANYSNIILDLNGGTVGKITVYATNVDIINGTASELEVRSGASLVLDYEHGHSLTVTNKTVNYGTIEVGKSRSMDKVENHGTLTIAEGATVNALTMRAGTAKVDGTLTSLTKMEDGKIEVGDKAAFTAASKAVEGGIIISKVSLNQTYINDDEEYVYCRHDDETGKTLTYYMVPRADLQVAVKFLDVETGEYVTNLTADKVYEVEAQVVYNGEEVLKDDWKTVKITSKNTDVLMAVTEDPGKKVKALKDGKVTLEVVFAEGNEKSEVKREVEVTVGKVEEEPTNPENPENKPAENNKDLDKTPKTGDYIEIAAAMLAVVVVANVSCGI